MKVRTKTEAAVPGLTESFRISLAASALVVLLMLGATVATMLDERPAQNPQRNPPSGSDNRDQDALSHANAIATLETGLPTTDSRKNSLHLAGNAAKDLVIRTRLEGPSREEWRQGKAHLYGASHQGSIRFSSDCHVSNWFDEVRNTNDQMEQKDRAPLQVASVDPEVLLF